jgi:hypothetical protein
MEKKSKMLLGIWLSNNLFGMIGISQTSAKNIMRRKVL